MKTGTRQPPRDRPGLSQRDRGRFGALVVREPLLIESVPLGALGGCFDGDCRLFDQAIESGQIEPRWCDLKAVTFKASSGRGVASVTLC